jgi:hypothetical protein
LIRAKKPRNKSNDDQIKHLQACTTNPTKANLKNKMFRNKMIDKNKANDASVDNKGKENTRGKNPC